MSNRFHNKFHRQNHHSKRTAKNDAYNDAGYDPIASFDSPFQGEFFSEGDLITTENLSAQKSIFSENATFKNDLVVQNNAQIVGTLNVGGNAALNSNLTIYQNLSVVGNSVIDGNLTVLGSAVELDTTVVAGSALTIANYGTGPALSVTQYGSEPIAHFIDANGDDIIFQDNGYVGLGTNSPNEKLTVVGNISSVGNLIVTGNVYLTGNNSIEGNLQVDTNVLFVDVANNLVGINTNTPNAELTIVGDVSSSGNLIVDTNTILGSASSANTTTVNGSLSVISNNENSSFTIFQEGSGNSVFITNSAQSVFVVDSQGRVGISTEMPNEALTVVGNVSSTGNLYSKASAYISGDLTVLQNISSTGTLTISSINNGNTNDVITKDANNTLEAREINSRVWDTSANFLSGALTQNYLPKFDSSSSLVNSIIYDDGVFVGINTSSPTDTLTVQGSSKFFGNVTIFGDLTASGTSTFANTVFSTTSALSVVHIGSGPAAWIGNDGTGDIASFYDIDADVEVLHVGGINGTNPNVGVKTGTPNVDFTVNGEISASENLYVAGSAVIGTLTTGSTNTVVTHNSNNVLETRTINSKIWDTNANFLSGALTQNFLPKFDSNSTVVNSNVYSSGGFVGIDTTNPNKKFTVVGEISSTQGLYSSNGTFVGSVTSNGAVILNKLNMSNNLIVNVVDPVSAQDAATKSYADTLSATLQNNIDVVEMVLTNSLTSVSAYSETQFINLSTKIEDLSAFTITELFSADGKINSLSSYAETQFSNLSTKINNVSAYSESQFIDINTYVRSNYLPLTGGSLTGGITVTGNISASGVIVGLSGLEIGSSVGSSSLYVEDQRIGINTETPNEALTIVGNISASGIVYGDGSGLANTDDLNVNTTVQSFSGNWNDVYTTVQTNSAVEWSYQGTDLKELSGNWESTFNTVKLLSASWEESAEIIPTVTNYLSTNNVLVSSLTIADSLNVSGVFNAGAGVGTSVLYVGTSSVGINIETPNEPLTVLGNISASGIVYGDGSGLFNVDNVNVNTTVQTYSADWINTYSTVQANSATEWNNNAVTSYVASNYLPLSGGVIIGGLSSASTFVLDVSSTQDAFRITQKGEGNVFVVEDEANSDTTPFVITNTGRVGVGTLNPVSKLTLVEDNVNAFRIANNETLEYYAAFGLTLSAGYFTAGSALVRDVPLIFRTALQGAEEERVRFTADGKVGIGNSAPNESLTVSGNISATGSIYGDGTNLTGIVPGDLEATTLVRASSASWDYQGTDLKALSANWQNTYLNQTNYLPLSGGNLTGTTNVSGVLSATSMYTGTNLVVGTPATTTAGTSAVTTIVAVTALPIVVDPNTLYIVI